MELLETCQSELEGHERTTLSVLSGGSVGEAVALAEAGGLALYREMVKLLGNIGSLNIEAVHSLADLEGLMARARCEDSPHRALCGGPRTR